MKKYLLFGYDAYYPGGGWTDFIGDFDTAVEIINYLTDARHTYQMYDLIDRDTMVEAEGQDMLRNYLNKINNLRNN